MLKSNIITENQEKDLKKLSIYVTRAKGYRTINGFAADCRTNADYLADVINARINSYPTIQFLKLIADNSEERVSLKDLKLACGYSLYENNDMEQIKNIQANRGGFYYANLGDKCIDSEYGGYRLVLVIQNNMGNLKSSTTIIIPVTSRKTKSKMPTHVHVGLDCGLQQDSIISCEQTRCISKRRLSEKISECPKHILQKVDVALGKATGTIDLNVSESDAIEALFNLNKNKVVKFRQDNQVNSYNDNLNYKPNNSQVIFA